MASVDSILNALIYNAFQGKIKIPPEQEDQLRNFLPGANLEILRKALAEIKGVALKKSAEVDIIPHLHRVYHRKLAEQADLYPVFHIFETGYRSFLSMWMEDHYGTVEWWREHYDRLSWISNNRSKEIPPRVTHVNNLAIPNRVSYVIENFVENVAGPSLSLKHLAGLPSSSIFDRSKLSDLEALIEEQWPQIGTHLSANFSNGMPVTQNNFIDKFKYVREARNTSFHHREVSSRAMVMSIAEELLDLIGVHLGTAIEHIRHAFQKRLAVSVAQHAKHRLLEPKYADFDVSYSYSGDGYGMVTLKSYCSGTAISRFIGTLDAGKLSKLTEIRVGIPTSI